MGLVRIGSGSLALVMVVGACGSPGTSSPSGTSEGSMPEATSPEDASPPGAIGSTVQAQVSVDVTRAAIPGLDPFPLRARYHVDAELAPAQEGPVDECDAAPPSGTGAARFQVELHHTNDPGKLGPDTEDVQTPKVSANPVDGALAATAEWVHPGEGGCARLGEAPGHYFQDGWNHDDVVTLEGYLFGVDIDDPSGAGLELQFERHDDLDNGEEPVTLELLY